MRRVMTTAIAVLGVTAVVVLVGCATPQYIPTIWYTVDPPVDVRTAGPGEKSLGIRFLEAARPCNEKMIFREGVRLDRYPSSEWAELPARVTTRALTEAITRTGRFSDVGDAADMAAPDLILTGDLLRFEELRTADGAKAVCEIHIDVRSRTEAATALYSGTWKSEIPLPEIGPAALATAMGTAVGEVVSKLANELAGK